MRQNSEHFMDEMLKDNVQAKPQGEDLGEKIASIIDAKMKEAMQKYSEALQTVNPPEEESGNIERKGENENEEDNGEAGDEEDE